MSKKIHRAWIILIAMVLIQSGIIGILMNCTGILFAAILTETGFRAGDLSVYYTIRALVSAATINIACRFFFQKNARITMAVLGVMKRTGLRLFHNHMMIEPVIEIFGGFRGDVIAKLPFQF